MCLKGEYPLRENKMQAAEIKLHRQNELEVERPQIWRVILVRHGEQLDRTDEKSPLSPIGRVQFRAWFGGFYLLQLDLRDGKPLATIIEDTKSVRTAECADIATDMLRDFIRDRDAHSWLKVFRAAGDSHLRANGLFKPYLDLGMPVNEASVKYFNSSDEENERHGAPPVRQVVESFEKQAADRLGFYTELFPGHDIDLVVPNHEGTLGACVKFWHLDDDCKIKPTEALAINFKPNGEKKLEFRGKTHTRPAIQRVGTTRPFVITRFSDMQP